MRKFTIKFDFLDTERKLSLGRMGLSQSPTVIMSHSCRSYIFPSAFPSCQNTAAFDVTSVKSDMCHFLPLCI